MAKGKNESAALAKPSSSGVLMAETIEMPKDWLSDVLGDVELGVTGTEEMGQEDVRLPSWLLNSKKEDKESGRQAPDDTFWNTITETTKDKLRLVVLTNHKSRQWREEDKATKKLAVQCSSWDGVNGRMADDTTRPCAKCPDYEWRTDPQTKKRSRRCTDVYNLVSLDRETGTVCVVKVKKTAIKGFRLFYQTYFHKKRRAMIGGKLRIVDNPFFAAETVVESEKREGGGYTWYVPRFTFGGALPKEEILGAAEIVESYLHEYLERASKTADAEESEEPASGGDVIDASEFSDDAPQPATSSSGNRF